MKVVYIVIKRVLNFVPLRRGKPERRGWIELKLSNSTLTLSTLPLGVLPPKGDKNTSYKIQSTPSLRAPSPARDNFIKTIQNTIMSKLNHSQPLYDTTILYILAIFAILWYYINYITITSI
jgi:hypothetical protein